MNGRLMRQEMAQQPAVLGDLVAVRDATVDLARGIAPRRLSGVLLVAPGSSDNKGPPARYLLELSPGNRPHSWRHPSRRASRRRAHFRVGLWSR
jgi:fructoselysine-6-P-deglycase FrlB-like protein